MKTFISTLTCNTTRNRQTFFEVLFGRSMSLIIDMSGLYFRVLTPVRVHITKRR